MKTSWNVALTVGLCACHAKAIRPSAQHGVRGVVRESSGAPLRASVTVTVTSAASGLEIAAVPTDRSGEFILDVPPGQYAFAVTSTTGFAFVEKLTMPTRDLVIKLSSACYQQHGRVMGTVAPPAAVSLSRVSKNVGDRFVASIASDGGFGVCLPEGTYSTQIEGAMASLETPVVVHSDAVVELAGYAISLIERVPVDVHIANTDLGSFAQSLHGRRIVGLGEANHGTGDFYTYRGRLSLELARSGDLRSVLLEADAITMFSVDDYVLGADVDVAKVVADIGFWITDIQEFLTFLAEVRTYNAAMPPARKVHVLGIDAQRLGPPVQLLLAHRVELAISEREAELLTQIAPEHGATFSRMSPEERAMLFSLLDRLESPAGPMDLAAGITRASIAARSVRYQLGYVGKVGTGALRDLAMAELAAYLVGIGGAGQVALWAHDGHIARQPDGANKTVGQHLFERFGDAYYPIAFLSYRGDGRAWDEAGKIGVIPHELAPAPPYNVESVIMNATGFVDVAWVRLDTANGALRQWLLVPRYVREFGSAYHPKDTQTLRAFPAAVAAVVVIQHATSSTPTPTGVRKVTQ